MSKLMKPSGYRALLDTRQTEQGIKLIKDFFQQNLSTELRLRRVTAPLFVLQGLGINDDSTAWSGPLPSPSMTWAWSRPRWFTRWPSGNGCRWPNMALSRAMAYTPT